VFWNKIVHYTSFQIKYNYVYSEVTVIMITTTIDDDSVVIKHTRRKIERGRRWRTFGVRLCLQFINIRRYYIHFHTPCKRRMRNPLRLNVLPKYA